LIFCSRTQTARSETVARKLNEALGKDARKREAMARLVDMTNASSKDIAAVNINNAVSNFARFPRDTGSPEVQGTL
jgi:hypothetical protein